MSAFLATTLLEGRERSGGRSDEPKADQQTIIRRRVLRNNYLEGFYHTVPSPLCKYIYLPVDIIVILRFSMHVIAALI